MVKFIRLWQLCNGSYMPSVPQENTKGSQPVSCIGLFAFSFLPCKIRKGCWRTQGLPILCCKLIRMIVSFKQTANENSNALHLCLLTILPELLWLCLVLPHLTYSHNLPIDLPISTSCLQNGSFTILRVLSTKPSPRLWSCNQNSRENKNFKGVGSVSDTSVSSFWFHCFCIDNEAEHHNTRSMGRSK